MSHTADPSSNPKFRPQPLTNDLLESGPGAAQNVAQNVALNDPLHDPASEIATLRDFNAKLLERISEFRRRNFELSKHEAELQTLRQNEAKMRSALAKITDESWAKDLEIEALKKQTNTAQDETERLSALEKKIKEKETELRFASEKHMHELESLKETNASLKQQLNRLTSESVRHEQDIETIRRLETECKNQKKQLEQATNLMADLERELETSRASSLEEMQALQYAQQEKARAFEGELSRVKVEYESKMSEMQSRLGRELEALSKLASERDARIRQLESLQSDHEEQIQGLHTLLSAAEIEKQENAQALAKANQHQSWQAEAFRRDLEQMRKESEEITGQLRLQLADMEAKRAQEIAAAAKIESENRTRIQELETEAADRARQILDAQNFALHLKKELEALKTEHQAAQDHAAQTLWETNQKHTGQVDLLRKNETQLTSEIASLRHERSLIEKRFHEASEKAAELRNCLETEKNEHRIEIRNLRHEAEQALSELQAHLKAKMLAEFQSKFEVVLSENARLKQALEVRDNSTEIERKELQKRQVQLNLLEQQLRQSANLLKSDKSEILRLSKQLANELQQPRSNPVVHSQRQVEERTHSLMTIINNLSEKTTKT